MWIAVKVFAARSALFAPPPRLTTATSTAPRQNGDASPAEPPARSGTLADAVLRRRAFHAALPDGSIGVDLPGLLDVSDCATAEGRGGREEKAGLSRLPRLPRCRDCPRPPLRRNNRQNANATTTNNSNKPDKHSKRNAGAARRRRRAALPPRPRRRARRRQARQRALEERPGGARRHRAQGEEGGMRAARAGAVLLFCFGPSGFLDGSRMPALHLAEQHSNHNITCTNTEQTTHNDTNTQTQQRQLADFGLSKLLVREKDVINLFGAGTATHLAPELLRAGTRITPAADVYAFGILMWCAFGGGGVGLLVVGPFLRAQRETESDHRCRRPTHNAPPPHRYCQHLLILRSPLYHILFRAQGGLRRKARVRRTAARRRHPLAAVRRAARVPRGGARRLRGARRGLLGGGPRGPARAARGLRPPRAPRGGARGQRQRRRRWRRERRRRRRQHRAHAVDLSAVLPPSPGFFSILPEQQCSARLSRGGVLRPPLSSSLS